jgi:hypothetical protein
MQSTAMRIGADALMRRQHKNRATLARSWMEQGNYRTADAARAPRQEEELLVVFRLHNLFATVKPVRAHMVAQVYLTGGRLNGRRRIREEIV